MSRHEYPTGVAAIRRVYRIRSRSGLDYIGAGPHDVSVFELRPLRGFVYLEKTFLRADLTIYDSSWDMPTTKGAGPHELE